MNPKTVNFGRGSKTSAVSYTILDNVVYFTQTAGVYSSINGAEQIVEVISDQEGLNWTKYRWVDIQRKPRYSENCEDQLIFEDPNVSDSICVTDWEHVEVPDQVFQALHIDDSEEHNVARGIISETFSEADQWNADTSRLLKIAIRNHDPEALAAVQQRIADKHGYRVASKATFLMITHLMNTENWDWVMPDGSSSPLM